MNSSLHFALPRYGSYGLGAASAAANAGLQVGTTIAQGASAAAIGAAGPTGAIAAALGGTAVAIPVVGAAIAGVAIAISAILNSGCGQTCIETSQWANQAEPLLQQNIEAYFQLSTPRPQSLQQAAMQNFMSIWNRLVALCSQPGLGAAGKNCIGDRQQGACKWKATATGAYAGQPAQGQCWNWFNAYYTPIQQDTQTYNDSIAASAPSQAAAGVSVPGTSSIFGSGSSITGSGSTDILLIAAVVGGALLLVSQL